MYLSSFPWEPFFRIVSALGEEAVDSVVDGRGKRIVEFRFDTQNCVREGLCLPCGSMIVLLDWLISEISDKISEPDKRLMHQWNDNFL